MSQDVVIWDADRDYWWFSHEMFSLVVDTSQYRILLTEGGVNLMLGTDQYALASCRLWW